MLSTRRLYPDTTRDELKNQLLEAGVRSPVVSAVVGILSASDLLNLDEEGWNDSSGTGIWNLISTGLEADHTLENPDKFRLKLYTQTQMKKKGQVIYYSVICLLYNNRFVI